VGGGKWAKRFMALSGRGIGERDGLRMTAGEGQAKGRRRAGGQGEQRGGPEAELFCGECRLIDACCEYWKAK
jgi:hypothetical protein